MRRHEMVNNARRNVGSEIRWQGETPVGRIVDVVVRNGYPRYVIEWGPDAPAHWASEISAANSTLLIGLAVRAVGKTEEPQT